GGGGRGGHGGDPARPDGGEPPSGAGAARVPGRPAGHPARRRPAGAAVSAERQSVAVEGGVLDVLDGGVLESERVAATARLFASLDGFLPLIADATGARVVCVNPRGVGGSAPPRPDDMTLERVADDLDAVRRALGIGRWVVWGMSGGSMVAQIAAR